MKEPMHMRKQILLAALVVAGFGVACAKKEAPAPPPPAVVEAPTAVPTTPPAAVAVGNVTVGNAIGADKKVTTPSDTLGVKDKVYASVETTGQGHAKLRALWSYMKGDKTSKVNETSMEFDATGPATNEFHIENNKPWPKGDYKVEIFLHDAATPGGTKTFKIQ
jgi:hypothetical protein